ncbi:MAG: serine/threonine protein kinase [Gemmatimonadales bacterium]|nr:MAG: serine/threonine protein kinase [Gemmatimonadales bacterium]
MTNPSSAPLDGEEALFFEAMDWPEETREARIREACAADEGMAERVLARVRAAARADAFLRRLGTRLPGEARPGGDGEWDGEGGAVAIEPPVRVGPWRLVRILGRGGMGAVHLGERDDGAFEQRVAVKILAPTLGSRMARARFDRERRILARMEHPNVARLLDGGVTPEGLPFLAMEYVDGRPIDRYVREEGLSVDARLALILQVLEAVRFAHANLVIHRDLKPSNILVDGRGTVKLLDFGIARLLGPEGAEEPPSTLTRGGMVALTPAHASPEQLRGEVVTTASDVFSLGVLLHLLLTGEHPFQREGRGGGEGSGEGKGGKRGSGPPSLERAMLTDNPIPPSQQVGDPRLRRRLRGDLDTIVATALQPSPQRRYASVDALHEDLRLHRAGLPIRARPDRLGYRASRFLKRNAWEVGVGAAGILLVGMGLLGHTTRLAAERDRADDARVLAEAEAQKAGEVTAFLVDLFQAADPFDAQGEIPTALDLLERGEARLERLAGEPMLQAELAGVLGSVHENLGRHDRAEYLHREAVTLLRREGPEGPDLARALTRWGVTLGSLARVEEAEAVHREALELAITAEGGGGVVPEDADAPDEVTGMALHNLGAILLQRGLLPEAEEAYREAVARRSNRGDPLEVASSLHGLGTVLHAASRFPEALEAFQEAASARGALLGEDHPLTLFSLGGVAGTWSSLGEVADARGAYLEILELRRRALGPDHPDVATTLHQLAMQDWQEGNLEGAEGYWLQAREIRQAAFGPDHPTLGGIANNLAAVARERGDLSGTEAMLRESLRIYRAAYGERHPEVARGIHNLAATVADMGRFPEAERLYRESLAMRLELLGEEHTDTAHSLHNLGRFLTAVNQWDEAEAMVERALGIRTRLLGEAHPDAVESADILRRVREAKP